MVKHFSTPGMQHQSRGIYLTVSKEMHFLIKISQIRAQIFKAASNTIVTVGKGERCFIWKKKYINKGVLCVTFFHIFAGSVGHLFSFITCPVAKWQSPSESEYVTMSFFFPRKVEWVSCRSDGNESLHAECHTNKCITSVPSSAITPPYFYLHSGWFSFGAEQSNAA